MSTTAVTSVKWISTGTEEGDGGVGQRGLVQQDVQEVFRPVWSSPANLISIFGRARQGKSFLMNCLSGEKEVFRVSNEKESCTQGIDLSTKWMPLQDFATVDHARLPPSLRNSSASTSSAKQVKVGFVDAEGQGDRDVSYDANLICPILLLSKVVVFNWKGDLQKDHILSTLGIMTRAAQNVSDIAPNPSGKVAKKFGHLHIVFRDWQAADTNPTNTFETLFKMESSADAMARNQIRRDILEAFTSIEVWLFDAPTDSVKDLKSKLTIDKTSETFRTQLRVFREKLAIQLNTPMTFADVTMTGKTMYHLVHQLTQTLNKGEAILPTSTYLNMMKEELHQLAARFQQDLRKLVDAFRAELDSEVKHQAVFMSKHEAQRKFRDRLVALHECYESEHLSQVFGDEVLASSRALYDDFIEKMTELEAQMSEDVMLHHHAMFLKYLVVKRQRLEQQVDVCLQGYQSKVGKVIYSKDEIASLLQEEWEQIAQMLIGEHGQQAQGLDIEVKDALDILQRHFQSQAQQLVQQFDAHHRKLSEQLQASLQQACETILQSIQIAANDLLAVEPFGFARSLLEKALNGEYFRLHGELTASFDISLPMVKAAVDKFTAYCGQLKPTMIETHEEMKNTAIRNMVLQAQDSIEQKLDASISQLDHADDEDFDDIDQQVDASVLDTWHAMLATVAGWLLPANQFTGVQQLSAEQWRVLENSEEGKNLHDFLLDFALQYKEIVRDCKQKFAKEQLKKKEAEQAAAASAAAAAALKVKQEQQQAQEEEEETFYDPDEEEEESVMPSGSKASSSSSSRVPLTSAEAQKAKAREWAAAKFGIKDKKYATATTKENRKTTANTKPMTSAEEQKQKARAFAAKQFGASVLDASDDEIDDDDEISPKKTAISKAKGEDILAQARLAAQQAMQENANKRIQAIPPAANKKAKK